MRQVGWICAAAQGIEVKDRRRCPLNWLVKFKRRPERRCVGKALRIRPSVRPHAEMRSLCAHTSLRTGPHVYSGLRQGTGAATSSICHLAMRVLDHHSHC